MPRLLAEGRGVGFGTGSGPDGLRPVGRGVREVFKITGVDSLFVFE
jgi:hypothetical protein